ncbi:MAG: hypothetical protein AB1571_03365 [Nanoarchaeota archaeon]
MLNINKLPFSLALLISLFEAFALFLYPSLMLLATAFMLSLPIFNIGIFELSMIGVLVSMFIGFIDGIFAAIPPLIIYKYLPKIYFNGLTVTKIPLFKFSMANGLFIALLFAVEYFTNRIRASYLLPLIAFTLPFVISYTLIRIYNKLNFKLKVYINNRLRIINKISCSTAVLFGLFEFFILPIMLLFLYLNISFFVSGLLSGLIGSLIAIVLYNHLINRFIKISLEI